MRSLILSLLVLLAAPAVHAEGLAGLWVGYYAYDPANGGARVECSMVLEQIDEEFGGLMIERQTFGDGLYPSLPSSIFGSNDGYAIRFEKIYMHQIEMNPDQATPVIYTLSLSPNGNMLSGYWSIGDMSGTAMFKRVTPQTADKIPTQ